MAPTRSLGSPTSWAVRRARPRRDAGHPPNPPGAGAQGAITPLPVAQTIAALLPENAIVVDESADVRLRRLSGATRMPRRTTGCT